MNAIVEAVSLLTPFDIDKPKIRIGPPSDGGYIFVDDIRPEQAVLSFGIGTEYRFDRQMAERGHDVFMFDHTIAGIDMQHPRMHFFKEGISAKSHRDASLYSLGDHLDRHNIKSQDIILKIDVEGAEFDVLAEAPDELLSTVGQISVEVHSLERLANPNYLDKFCRMFRKLNRQFTLFHVHANNWDGPNAFAMIGGLPLPRILELSYVRTASVRRKPSNTLYPTALDFPNVGPRDKLLWVYPFMPTTAHPELFAFCADRLDLLERTH